MDGTYITEKTTLAPLHYCIEFNSDVGNNTCSFDLRGGLLSLRGDAVNGDSDLYPMNLHDREIHKRSVPVNVFECISTAGFINTCVYPSLRAIAILQVEILGTLRVQARGLSCTSDE